MIFDLDKSLNCLNNLQRLYVRDLNWLRYSLLYQETGSINIKMFKT